MLQGAGVLAPPDADVLIASARLQHALTQVLRIALDETPEIEEATPGLKTLLTRAAGVGQFRRRPRRGWRICRRATREIFNRVMQVLHPGNWQLNPMLSLSAWHRWQPDQDSAEGQMHGGAAARGGADGHRLAAAGDADLEMIAFAQEGRGGDLARDTGFGETHMLGPDGQQDMIIRP